MIINGIDTDKVYSADEIVQMYNDGRLRDVALRGFVSRANADGTCQFIHWTKANRLTGDKDHKPGVYTPNFDMVAELEKGLPPIQKRTPQQRVASLILKILSAAGENEGKLGLTDAQLKEILGESWKAGMPLTMQDARRIAAHFLSAAEVESKKQERSQSAKLNRKQRREQERKERQERARWEKLREAGKL